MMEGSEALTDVEENGMRIDVDYLDKVIIQTGEKIREMEQTLRSDEVFTVWRKQFGEKADLGSRHQLGKVIFGCLGVESKKSTKGGKDGKVSKPSTDIEALEDVDFPFVRRYLTLEKLKKARSTYLVGLRREVVVVDGVGLVRPSLNLHLASTFRSSGSDPNLQNQPVRDKRQAKLIRSAFIPRSSDYILVEVDYSALEFRGAASFWTDERMIAYASNPDLDIHRDMAMECYLLERDQVSKPARSFAKNQFVFPVLYGSYWGNCAPNLWSQIGRGELKRVDGLDLYEHLAQKGIDRLGRKKTKTDRGDDGPGTYLNLIREVEEEFNKKFPTWSEQKDVWWNQYLERGWFPLSTGFVVCGVFSYNNLMNTPIQGPSFHCLLWSLIQLNKWLKKYKMKSKIICEVHDSLILDVFKPELPDVINQTKKIMTEDVREAWRWIKTPLGVEIEASEVNWFLKKPLAI